jgi:initiation factor 1A
MPNVKGGKGYKRGKNSGEEAEKMIEWKSEDGEMIGRVTKVLGSRRFIVYCNDNVIRTCRICGSMRKADWINLGAIVLIGARTLGTSTSSKTVTGGGAVNAVGDIIHLFGSSMYRDLKNMPNTNSLLFTCLEDKDKKDIDRIRDNEVDVEDEDFFLNEGEEETDDIEGETAAEKNARLKEKQESKEASYKVLAKERAIEMKSKREITLDEL